MERLTIIYGAPQ